MAKALSVRVVQSGLDSSIQEAGRNIKPIRVPVNVDASAFKNLAQPLGRVSGLATEFEKSIAASNARVLAFGASVGIINGVQNAFANLLTTGIEVQKVLAEIGAISGRSGEDLSKFGDSLFETGKLTGQSFKTAAQAALEFSRQGLSTEQTLKRTTDALTLTRFTTLNAAEAVDILTAAANSFGDTGITTAEILNKLVAVDTKFAVSAEDLANGLARAGSIAQEVGVSFDELNAAITIAQERTARGGSVIGNALKTIFTRLRSDETVQALRAIGVESLNAQGGLKGAIPLLEEVAQKLQGLSEGERIQILEAIASKYNINILSAILTDLSDANKKFGEVVAISAGAGNQAYERQVELNKALAAQINITTVSVEQLFNKLAEIGVTENLNNLLKFVNGLLDGINKILDSESTGGNIAKGLIKGISDIFFTVGLPLLAAIFVKLTKDIAQFGVESLRTILGINQQVRERQALEQAVVNTLIRDQEIMATILSLSGNRAKQEEYLLSVYNRQLAALKEVQTIAAGVAPALQAAGLSATSGTVKKRAAEGYLPAQEAADVRRGVGGADKNAKVVKIPNFSFGGGKKGTMYANTSEYIVPNYNGGDGTAIFNKDMVSKYGKPENAKKINAATGYIPNYIKTQPKNIQAIRQGKKFEQSLNLKLFGEASYAANAVLDFPKPEGFGADSEVKKELGINPQSEYGDAKRTQSRKSEKSLLDKYLRTPEGSAEFLNAKETARGFINLNPKGLSMLFLEQGQDAKETAYLGTKESILSEKTKDLIKTKFGDKKASKTIAMPYIADKINKSELSAKKASTGYIPNFQQQAVGEKQLTAKEKELKTKAEKVINNRVGNTFGTAAMLVKDQADEQKVRTDKTYPWGFEPKEPENKIFGRVKFPVYGLKDSGLQQAKLGAVPKIKEPLDKIALDFGTSVSSDLAGRQVSQAEYQQSYKKSFGAAGAFGGVVGGIFESAARVAFNFESDKVNTLDVPNIPDPMRLAFGITGGERSADLKGSVSDGVLRGFASQAVKNNLVKEEIREMTNAPKKVAAKGFVPNYAEKLTEMYDWDGTIIPKISGKPEEYIQSIQKLEKKDLLPVGKELAASKEKFDIATARPIAFKDPIKNAAQNLGLNVEKIFPLGSMFENRRTQGKRGPRKLYSPERKALFAERTGRSIVDDEEENLMALGSRGINANLRNRASFGFIPNFASQNAIDAMRRIISDPAAPQGEKDAASLKLSQLAKASSSKNPKTTTQKTAKTKLPITQEDKDYLNQNKEKIVAGMGRSFGMLFNLDALEMGDLGYVKRLDPIVAKKLSEIAQKQGGRDSIRSLVDFGSAAKGYIPNFAENEPLKEAISREMGAGVPAARVRVTQDGRLKNPKNPNGLAVINTRDEPNGKIPNDFRERGMRAAMASRGFVPNFANISKKEIEETLGKPPRRKNTKIYTGGKDFDYGVKDDKKPSKQLETNTNKLIASFVGLQLATSTLQSTFKDSESVIGKTLTTISQIGSSAVGYGSLGSLLGDTLKEKGGLTGQIGKIAGQAGILVGTVLGTITAISDILDEQREVLEKKRTTAGKSDIANILNQNAGLSEQTQREALSKKRKEIEFELSQRQRLIETNPYNQYVGGGENAREADLEKAKDLQNQINNFKAKEFELTTAILNANIRQSQQREQALKKEKEELASRVSLEKVRISLSEAFAANELSFEKERNDRQLQYIKNEIFLSEIQKNILRDREQLTKVQEEEFKLNASSVKSILEKVKASGELTSIDALNVGNLETQLKFGKRITDVRETINSLALQGVSNLELIVLTALSDLKIAQDKRTEEERFLLVRQKNVAQSQAQLNIERSISQAISNREQANRQAFDDSFNYEVDSNLAENQRELLELRQQIASQPFATPEQEAQLGRLTLSTEQYSNVLRANAELVKQTNSIFRNTQKDFTASFSDTGQLNFLSPQIREGFIKDLLDTENLTELEDALAISINTIRTTLSEEIDLSSLEPEEATALMKSYGQAITDAYGSLIEKGLIANQQLDIAEKKRNIAISQVRTLADFEQKIKEIREKSPATAGLYRAFTDLNKEAINFTETFSYETTFAFRDGLRDALGAAISQTDDLGAALQNVATSFLKTMQQAFLQQASNQAMIGLQNAFPTVFPKASTLPAAPAGATPKLATGGFISNGKIIKGYASGGLVTGGSGYRDDVPAMLSQGEYVIRKSSVQKYGAQNLEKMNSGGMPTLAAGGDIFLPGVRGAGNISGYKDLTRFANQVTTSGATDVMRGTESSAFVNLEDQSMRLSRFALLNEDDIVNQEIRSAQQQGLDIIEQREAYRTQQRKAFQKQLTQTVISAALNAGLGALSAPAPTGTASGLYSQSKMAPGTSPLNTGPSFSSSSGPASFGGYSTLMPRAPFRAYGGPISKYADGGPVDKIPALLMDGEYVMSRQATNKYGKQFFDSVNQGRAPRFADGGQVSTSEPSFAEKAAAMSDSKATGGTNVNINISVTGQSSQTQTEGETKKDGVDYKEMSKQIEQIVLKTIAEQKRAGGMLKGR